MAGKPQPLKTEEVRSLDRIVAAYKARKRNQKGVFAAEVVPGEGVVVRKLLRHGLLERIEMPNATRSQEMYQVRPTPAALKQARQSA